jgi:hypothetical protein
MMVLTGQVLLAQNAGKITGPLGVYHISAGYAYNDSTGTDSVLMQYELKFGELNMPNQAVDNGFDFQSEIDSCIQWNANRVFGIIQPPSEQGVYDQPDDTALYLPYALSNGPGMIQGGQRFSKLSQLYGPFCGLMLDDWNGDTIIARQVRDAVQGKYVDINGNVYSNSTATTPDNKLYIIAYDTSANPAAMSVIDGLSYWYVDAQNCCYANLDSDINRLRINYPGKEIMTGIYVKNTHLGWTDPVGVQYMLQHSLDRYDDGDINGILIFAGSQLVKSYMPLSEWNAFQLPFWLDSVYYPYLGEGQGALMDCNTRTTLPDAFVRVFCKGRISGDTLLRSRQKTDINGQYQFGLWAGNRNTDSTYYWLIAEKEGYVSDTFGFWIKRGDTTSIPNLSLCRAKATGFNELNNPKDNLLLFPNPTNGRFAVNTNSGQAVNGEMEIYNMRGEKVYAANHSLAHSMVDLSSQPDGIYLVRIKVSDGTLNLYQLVVLQH